MTSSKFQERILTADDNALLTDFYREEIQVGAPISFYLDRKKNFYDALQVEGVDRRIVAIYDAEKDKIAVAMICSWKPVFINGEESLVGYIGSLKVAEEYKKTVVVMRLFRFFKEVFIDSPVNFWLFSVLDNNEEGKEFFKRESKFLPIFQPMQAATTFIFRAKKELLKGRVQVRIAEEKDIPAILEFIRQQGRDQTFIPNYSARQLNEGKELLKGFLLKHLYLAFDDEMLVGTMGLWDQSPFRSWKANAYPKAVHTFRPLVNFFLHAAQYPQLPRLACDMDYHLLSLVMAHNERHDVYQSLLQNIMGDHAGKSICVTLVGEHKLRKLLPKQSFQFKSKLFVGYWPDAKDYVDRTDLSNLYIETGGL